MQKSIIHKASAFVGWREVAVVRYIAKNPISYHYEMQRGICTTSHISGLFMKMAYKIRELECINKFLSVETIIPYYGPK